MSAGSASRALRPGSETGRAAARLGVWSAAAVLGAVLTAALLRGVLSFDPDTGGDAFWWALDLTVAIVAGGWGVQRVSRELGDGIAWLLLAAGASVGVACLTETGAMRAEVWLPFGDYTRRIQVWSHLTGRALLLAAGVVLVPDRLLPGRAGRGPVVAAIAGVTVVAVTGLVAQPAPGDLTGTPFGFGNRTWIELADGVPAWAFAGMLAVHVPAMLLLARSRRGDEPSLFQILGWGLAACALPLALPQLGARLDEPSSSLLALVAVPILPVVSVVALLRAAALTARRLVSRTLVWSLLTGAIVVLQAVAVGTAGSASVRAGLLASVVVTAAVALAFQPARTALQAFIDRIVFGARRDPLAAGRVVGHQLEAAMSLDRVLPMLATAIREAYGLEGVAIDLVVDGDWQRVVTEGSIGDGAHELPLVHRGEMLGRLMVAASSSAPLRQQDLTSLRDVAAQAASVCYSVRVTLDLRRSGQQLVAAVEDERRRLSRELHDGLGPALGGIALGLRAVGNRIEDPELGMLVSRLVTEVQACFDDVRRLAYELRPPALDQLGLEGALQAHGMRCEASADSLTVRVDVSIGDETLPAAVELAAYRIASESLTNAVRHSRATRCEVRVRRIVDDVVVDVEDDGVGLPNAVVAGVGLTSMRERAAGVGGLLVVDARPTGGTRVSAKLPVVTSE